MNIINIFHNDEVNRNGAQLIHWRMTAEQFLGRKKKESACQQAEARRA